MKYYTGIGSRRTPVEIQRFMTQVAAALRERGWILRSGGADGADSAFEAGARGQKEIYLPWPWFNGNNSAFNQVSDSALTLAGKFHPAWERCSDAAKRLHARNCYQILGENLLEPSTFLMCWTPGGEKKGGTAQAMRIAEAYKIPILNLFFPQTREKIAHRLDIKEHA